MNEDFKRMDTRTSREQLNALAGAAGRLGITNQKMIEEFVDENPEAVAQLLRNWLNDEGDM